MSDEATNPNGGSKNSEDNANGGAKKNVPSDAREVPVEQTNDDVKIKNYDGFAFRAMIAEFSQKVKDGNVMEVKDGKIVVVDESHKEMHSDDRMESIINGMTVPTKTNKRGANVKNTGVSKKAVKTSKRNEEAGVPKQVKKRNPNAPVNRKMPKKGVNNRTEEK